MSDAVPIQGDCDSRFEGVRRIFEQNLASGMDLGAAVCFTLDGETVVDLWGGYVDLERTLEWQPDTIVSTASTTKGMTSICAHQLVEQGRLDLDAPVALYWPEFAAGGKERLRVRWLLSHQAGLPAVSKPLPEGALFDWDVMTSALADQKPWWEPGTKHGYHALTFGYLVGELIRRVSGKRVGTYFREHVAGPLEADFHIGLSPDEEARVSDIHGSPIPGPDELPQFLMEGPFGDFLREMEDPSTMTGAAFRNPKLEADAMNSHAWRAAEIPAGNGHGTARALARIYGALARGGEVDGFRILEKETIERAIEEQANGPDAVLGGLPMRFGLGFMLRQDLIPLSPNPRAFGHPGAGGSIGMADPDAKVGFGYVLNNSQTGITGAINAFAMIGAFFEAM